MTRIGLLFCFSFFISHCALGQGGTWTWISGDSTIDANGVFGTQGVPSVNNHPSSLYEPSDWKDKQGNFWLYGGSGNDVYNDLWKYNPGTNEWTWVHGNGAPNQFPVHGVIGIPDPMNTPGARFWASATWVDIAGNLWLFGGAVSDSVYFLNDLWKYDISINCWTWIRGDTIGNSSGNHGLQGIPSPLNNPGGRKETCSAWTDSLNNLWLFGGMGYDDNGSFGFLNDLCKYDIAANEWTWMKGSNYNNPTSNYGSLGIPNANNNPGGRFSYTKWKDSAGNFWLMGGAINWNPLSDVWKYNVSTNEWTWMSGSMSPYDNGNYQNTCALNSINAPFSRIEQRSSVTDNCGRFWLFGGTYENQDYFLNDLWLLDSKALQWEWLSGTNVFDQAGNHGTLHVASPANIPSSRWGALAWWGNDNRFYLFGGWGRYGLSCDLWAFNPDTNCVAVCLPPPNSGFGSSATTICAGDCINFVNNSVNASSYQWTFPGGIPSSSTHQNPQVCYLTPGIYNVTLIASGIGGSDTLSINNYITVIASPPTPLVKDFPGIGNDTLVCSKDTNYISYQWYLDSTIVSGATDTFLVVTQSGNYNVKVTNANGCKTAVGINVVIGLQNYMNDHLILLSPNPTGNKFTLYGLPFTVGSIDIYNMLGQLCGKSAIVNHKSEIEMDVSNLPPGIYFVQLIGEKARWTGRFVKE